MIKWYTAGLITGVLVVYFLVHRRRMKSAYAEMSEMSQIGANMQAQRDAAIKTVRANDLTDTYEERLELEKTALAAMVEAQGIDPDEFVIVDDLEVQNGGMVVVQADADELE